MLPQPRRRSPESSRRRRREKRRSREDLASMYSYSPTSSAGPRMPGAFTESPRQQTSQQYQYPPQQPLPQTQPIPQQQQYGPSPQQQPRGGPTTNRSRASSGSLSTSSSSSSSYLDISRQYPLARYGGLLKTFIKAPSEVRRRRFRRGSGGKKRGTIFGGTNSSNSSINSDMAYGTGYVRKDKDASAGYISSAAGGSASGSRRRDQVQTDYRNGQRDGASPRLIKAGKRGQTDEEILAIGRQLSDLARRSNEEDLRNAGKIRPSGLAATAAALSALRKKKKKDDKNRGLGSSKPHGASSSDESDWESASDDDSDDSSDGATSHLAFGQETRTRPPVMSGGNGGAGDSNLHLAYGNDSHIGPVTGAVMGAVGGAVANTVAGSVTTHSRKSSVVDPRLFGPYNSLRGLVRTPCGFGDDQQSPSAPGSAGKRRDYPPPILDPSRYETGAIYTGPQDGQRPRPGSVPIEQPIPKVPVSEKLYQSERFDSPRRRDSRNSYRSSRRESEDRNGNGSGNGKSVLAGVAAGGVAAAAAAAAARMADRRGPWTDDRIYRDDVKRRRDDQDDERLHRDQAPFEELERRRAKPDVYSNRRDDDERPEPERDVPDYYGKKNANLPKDERTWMELDPRERRDTLRYNTSDAPAQQQPTQATKAGDEIAEKAEQPVRTKTVDPFQYQVADFNSPQFDTPRRPLTPQVVTIERVPNFEDRPPSRIPTPEIRPDVRLSRKDSFEIERMVEDSNAKGKRESPSRDPRGSHDYEESEHEARSIYDEAKHATVPVAAAAFASAIAVEEERSRERRRREQDDDSSRNRRKDAVQEEADRYYRESVIARKITSDELRSRSKSPDESVVGRWKDDTAEAPIAIVTPPDMEDKQLDPSRFDGPNADVKIDNEIFPHEIHRFRVAHGALNPPVFKSRDESCERDRPMLNLVFPTPVPSRGTTPAPPEEKESTREIDESEPESREVRDPKGDVRPGSSGKSVTWGENSTKSFEVETPETRSRAESPELEDKPRPRLNKSSQWGRISAMIAAGTAEPTNELEQETPPKSRDVPVDVDNAPPSVPGPKPTSHQEQMPGSFDDLEFPAILAAGLKESGFDPNIVIDDPTYRRRDSPPDSKDGESPRSVESPSKNGKRRSQRGQEKRDKLEKYLQQRQSGEIQPPEEVLESRELQDESANGTLGDRRALQRGQPGEVQAPREALESRDLVDAHDATREEERRAKRDALEDFGRKRQSGETRYPEIVETEPEVREPETRSTQEVDDRDGSSKKSRRRKKKNRSREDEESTLSSHLDDERSGISIPLDGATTELSRISVPGDTASDLRTERSVDDWEDWDSSPRSSRKSLIASELSTSSKRSNKSKRRSDTERDSRENGHDPPDHRDEPPDGRGTDSVVSESRNDDGKRRNRESKSSRHHEDDEDLKSVSSRKSKDSEKKGGFFSGIFKGNSKDDEKRDSFLDNAGTLGAGAGLVGIAAAAASAWSHQNAADVPSQVEDVSRKLPGSPRVFEDLDPEVAPRAFKPAIDPQYGDLLPMPPSEPGSPMEFPDELPSLPESRPGTPPDERDWKMDHFTHRRRRSTTDSPIKTHNKTFSNTAIPLSLRMGKVSNPSSPVTFRPTYGSPRSAATPDSATRRQPRPTSWDSTREFMPLMLLEHTRQGEQLVGVDLPPLPASVASSETASEAASETSSNGESASLDEFDTHLQDPNDGFSLNAPGLRIDTDISYEHESSMGRESGDSTPKAEIHHELPVLPSTDDIERRAVPEVNLVPPSQAEERDIRPFLDDFEPAPVESMSRNRSSPLLRSASSSGQSKRTVNIDTSPLQSPTSPTLRQIPEAVASLPSEDLTSTTESSDAFESARMSPADVTPDEHMAFAEPSLIGAIPEFSRPAKYYEDRARKMSDATSVDTVIEPLAPVSAPPIPEVPEQQPDSSREASTLEEIVEEPKKNKKNKKKKKKSLSSELQMTPVSAIEADTIEAPVKIPSSNVTEDVLREVDQVMPAVEYGPKEREFFVEEKATAPEFVPEPALVESIQEVPTEPVVAEPEMPSLPEPGPEPTRDTNLEAPEELEASSSKKGKKKKKKNKKNKAAAVIAEDEAAPEAKIDDAPVQPTREVESVPEPEREVMPGLGSQALSNVATTTLFNSAWDFNRKADSEIVAEARPIEPADPEQRFESAVEPIGKELPSEGQQDPQYVRQTVPEETGELEVKPAAAWPKWGSLFKQALKRTPESSTAPEPVVKSRSGPEPSAVLEPHPETVPEPAVEEKVLPLPVPAPVYWPTWDLVSKEAVKPTLEETVQQFPEPISVSRSLQEKEPLLEQELDARPQPAVREAVEVVAAAAAVPVFWPTWDLVSKETIRSTLEKPSEQVPRPSVVDRSLTETEGILSRDLNGAPQLPMREALEPASTPAFWPTWDLVSKEATRPTLEQPIQFETEPTTNDRSLTKAETAPQQEIPITTETPFYQAVQPAPTPVFWPTWDLVSKEAVRPTLEQVVESDQEPVAGSRSQTDVVTEVAPVVWSTRDLLSQNTIQPTMELRDESTPPATEDIDVEEAAAPVFWPTWDLLSQKAIEPTRELDTEPAPQMTDDLSLQQEAAPIFWPTWDLLSQKAIQPTMEQHDEPAAQMTSDINVNQVAAPVFWPTWDLLSQNTIQPSMEQRDEPAAQNTSDVNVNQVAAPVFWPTWDLLSQKTIEPTAELSAESAPPAAKDITVDQVAAPVFWPSWDLLSKEPVRPTLEQPLQSILEPPADHVLTSRELQTPTAPPQEDELAPTVSQPERTTDNLNAASEASTSKKSKKKKKAAEALAAAALVAKAVTEIAPEQIEKPSKSLHGPISERHSEQVPESEEHTKEMSQSLDKQDPQIDVPVHVEPALSEGSREILHETAVPSVRIDSSVGATSENTPTSAAEPPLLAVEDVDSVPAAKSKKDKKKKKKKETAQAEQEVGALEREREFVPEQIGVPPNPAEAEASPDASGFPTARVEKPLDASVEDRAIPRVDEPAPSILEHVTVLPAEELVPEKPNPEDLERPRTFDYELQAPAAVEESTLRDEQPLSITTKEPAVAEKEEPLPLQVEEPAAATTEDLPLATPKSKKQRKKDKKKAEQLKSLGEASTAGQETVEHEPEASSKAPTAIKPQSQDQTSQLVTEVPTGPRNDDEQLRRESIEGAMVPQDALEQSRLVEQPLEAGIQKPVTVDKEISHDTPAALPLLESHISEPLFSQGEAPSEFATQLSEAISEPPNLKSKAKKNKKTDSVALEPLGESFSESQAIDSSASIGFQNEMSVDALAEEPAEPTETDKLLRQGPDATPFIEEPKQLAGASSRALRPALEDIREADAARGGKKNRSVIEFDIGEPERNLDDMVRLETAEASTENIEAPSLESTQETVETMMTSGQPTDGDIVVPASKTPVQLGERVASEIPPVTIDMNALARFDNDIIPAATEEMTKPGKANESGQNDLVAGEQAQTGPGAASQELEPSSPVKLSKKEKKRRKKQAEAKSFPVEVSAPVVEKPSETAAQSLRESTVSDDVATIEPSFGLGSVIQGETEEVRGESSRIDKEIGKAQDLDDIPTQVAEASPPKKIELEQNRNKAADAYGTLEVPIEPPVQELGDLGDGFRDPIVKFAVPDDSFGTGQFPNSQELDNQRLPDKEADAVSGFDLLNRETLKEDKGKRVEVLPTRALEPMVEKSIQETVNIHDPDTVKEANDEAPATNKDRLKRKKSRLSSLIEAFENKAVSTEPPVVIKKRESKWDLNRITESKDVPAKLDEPRLKVSREMQDIQQVTMDSVVSTIEPRDVSNIDTGSRASPVLEPSFGHNYLTTSASLEETVDFVEEATPAEDDDMTRAMLPAPRHIMTIHDDEPLGMPPADETTKMEDVDAFDKIVAQEVAARDAQLELATEETKPSHEDRQDNLMNSLGDLDVSLDEPPSQVQAPLNEKKLSKKDKKKLKKQREASLGYETAEPALNDVRKPMEEAVLENQREVDKEAPRAFQEELTAEPERREATVAEPQPRLEDALFESEPHSVQAPVIEPQPETPLDAPMAEEIPRDIEEPATKKTSKKERKKAEKLAREAAEASAVAPKSEFQEDPVTREMSPKAQFNPVMGNDEQIYSIPQAENVVPEDSGRTLIEKIGEAVTNPVEQYPSPELIDGQQAALDDTLAESPSSPSRDLSKAVTAPYEAEPPVSIEVAPVAEEEQSTTSSKKKKKGKKEKNIAMPPANEPDLGLGQSVDTVDTASKEFATAPREFSVLSEAAPEPEPEQPKQIEIEEAFQDVPELKSSGPRTRLADFEELSETTPKNSGLLSAVIEPAGENPMEAEEPIQLVEGEDRLEEAKGSKVHDDDADAPKTKKSKKKKGRKGKEDASTISSISNEYSLSTDVGELSSRGPPVESTDVPFFDALTEVEESKGSTEPQPAPEREQVDWVASQPRPPMTSKQVELDVWNPQAPKDIFSAQGDTEALAILPNKGKSQTIVEDNLGFNESSHFLDNGLEDTRAVPDISSDETRPSTAIRVEGLESITRDGARETAAVKEPAPAMASQGDMDDSWDLFTSSWEKSHDKKQEPGMSTSPDNLRDALKIDETQSKDEPTDVYAAKPKKSKKRGKQPSVDIIDNTVMRESPMDKDFKIEDTSASPVDDGGTKGVKKKRSRTQGPDEEQDLPTSDHHAELSSQRGDLESTTQVDPAEEQSGERPNQWFGALTGGISLLTERFGGPKKPQHSDKQQQKEESFLGNPALRTSGDDKSWDNNNNKHMTDYVLRGEDEQIESKEIKDVESTTREESIAEFGAGWRETAKYGGTVDEEDIESPVLGRGELALIRGKSREPPVAPGPFELLRRTSQVEDAVGGLLREASEISMMPPMDMMSELGDYRLSPDFSDYRAPSVLPAVEEIPEAEAEATKSEVNFHRDSGFAGSTPNQSRRHTKMFDEDDEYEEEEEQRDSGVHTADWVETAMANLKTPEPIRRTPEPHQQRRLRRSTLAGQKLRDSGFREVAQDPEKKTIPGTRERVLTGTGTRPETPTGRTSPIKKSYGTLTGPGTVSRLPGGAASPNLSPTKRSEGPALRRSAPSPPISGSLRGYARTIGGQQGLQRPESPSMPQGPSSQQHLPTLARALPQQEQQQQPRSLSDSHASPATGQSGALDLSSRPDPTTGVARRSISNSGILRQRTPEPLKVFPPEATGNPVRSVSNPTPPPALRRIDKRMSGDLRNLRQQNNNGSTASIPTATETPVANEGRVRSKDMPDVYDGFGEGRIGSPRSPTRPHSMRRRQSMQVIELEAKVEQLIEENRLLSEARHSADQHINPRTVTALSERDTQIESLKQSLKFLRNEVSRLSEVNEGLASANAELANKDSSRYVDLEVHSDGARGGQDALQQTLQHRDAEIADLRAQLDAAKEQIRNLQRQILESKAADSQFLNIKDEDYFDHRCQQLCSHVQQWVLRFSKFSDMRACRLTSEINDEKIIDRLDNAVLDGSDVDRYLNDRVRRRDIFMSMTMNMIWEFVFTRYLFGMDREQRQKLKSLEKLLTDVGPTQAVRQWRAVTLTLLAKRPAFKKQRDLDTEAVVQAIYQTLCKVLPPPSNLESQIQSQLRRVMHEAVQLSIEMRTQKAEYMMLPPLQPEYDADGELAQTVQFNASMMNERSGSLNMTNEELEAQGAIVRVVLFPLVVKKGDDNGVNDEEIVVCPAQVLIARSKLTRQPTPSSDGGRASAMGVSRLSGGSNSPEGKQLRG